MAVLIRAKPVTERLDLCIAYATNPEKTGLKKALEYAVNPEKTERYLFVSCLNCTDIESAFDEIQATKEQYHKTGGRLAYSFIQSFAEGEVTPEQAHLIGMRLAAEYFGDRFQVVVGTHLNTDNLHNHIVINSVDLDPANMNMILCDRLRLLNGNGFIFGKSGGGKSFTVKREMEDVILGTNDDVFILDPEREYGALVRALGGVVIRLSPASSNHINAMDMDDYYAGDDVSPIPAKIDFIVSLCEQSDDSLDQKDRSIIDRCAKKLLMEYVNNGRHGKAPTLVDLREEILHQSDKRAADIALSLEILTTGTLNTFSQETNVDLSNRLVCFDIKDLGTQLKTLGMLIALDAIINKVSQNRKERKRTWVYVDEFHLFNANEYARKFFIAFWKRARKYGALLTGITQNVGDLLRNSETHDILANSEFSVMLDQAPTDAAAFTALYNLSDEQVQHLQSGVVGHGLIKYGNAIVPFDDKFPTDTKLYKVMTTKIEETEEAG